MALSGPGLALCSLFTLYFGECANTEFMKRKVDSKTFFEFCLNVLNQVDRPLFIRLRRVVIVQIVVRFESHGI